MSESSGPTADGDEATPDQQLRRRYLEALDRKHGRAPGQAGGGTGEAGARTSAGSGPAKAQRTFRRKSGG